MSHATPPTAPSSPELIPEELVELRDRVRSQPVAVRAELEPLVEDVLEHARFRGRVLTVARDALEQLRHDLELARFDLDATRRERETLRQRLRLTSDGASAG